MGNKNYMPLDEVVINIRDYIVNCLAKVTKVKISNTDEQDPTDEPPYGYYAIVTPFVFFGEYGNYERFVVVDPVSNQPYIEHVRSESAEMVLSFNFCSANHGLDDDFIHGDTEAMSLATKAVSWLLHEGLEQFSLENIVLKNVSAASSRSGILADEYVRRWGFDITLRYKAQFMKKDDLLKVGIIKQKEEI